MKERMYQHIEPLSEPEIEEILERQRVDELRVLPLTVGLYHHSSRFAQNFCLRLADHEDAGIRANALLGLAHTARTKGGLDKRTVKPILLRELKHNEQYRGIIQDAIEDINLFMKWHIARKHEL